MYQRSLDDNEILIRSWKNDEDYEIFNSLGNLYGQTYRVKNIISAKDARAWLEAQEGFEPENMIFIVEAFDQPIGLQCFYPIQTKDNTIIFRVWMVIHPDWIRSSVLAESLVELEKKIISYAQEMDCQNAIIQSLYQDSEKWRQQLLESRGFQSADYFFEMTKPVDEFYLSFDIPEAITLKPADTLQKEFEMLRFESVSIEEIRGYRVLTDEMISAIRSQDTYNPFLWKIAWDGDDVVGIATNYVDLKENRLLGRKRGYIEKITCHPDYEKGSIARVLFSESIKMFREMGMHEIAFDVDIINEKEELELAESFGFKAKKYIVGMHKNVVW